MGGTPSPLPVPDPGAKAATPGPHPGPEPGPGPLGTPSTEVPDPLFGTEAVFEALASHPAVKALAPLATDAKWAFRELSITVPARSIVAACQAVQAAGYNFFEDLTAVDWYPQEPRMQLSYSLLSMDLKQRVRLIVRLDSDSLSAPSITGVWPAANFYEREVFDLFGVDFPGHPRLTRIMMPVDWNGHPLRKDYPVEGYR
jgi:NADH-quinone oxidoreductase subunit C